MTRETVYAALLGLVFLGLGLAGVLWPRRMRWLSVLGVWWVRLLSPEANATITRVFGVVLALFGCLILGSILRHLL